jgi:aminoglycoside phosphotransferase (APT) family kinase protein
VERRLACEADLVGAMMLTSHRRGKAAGPRLRALTLAHHRGTKESVSQITKAPAAEVVVDTQTIRALLGAQHPDLSELPLEEVPPGWDNFIFRLGEGMSVRLPRRLASVAMLEHEQRWLPSIAPQLPVPVPAPLRIGKPGDQYPWPWSIVPWLSGETADLAPLTADQSKPLARLLRALHVAAPADAPKSPARGVPLQQRAIAVQERMQRLAQKTSLANSTVFKIWESALEAPPAELSTWFHGDLHPQNVLVEDGKLTGVIDWADIAAGDSATDLASIWMLLPTVAAREAAMAEYGSASPGTWARALGWAINLGTLLLETGLVDNPRHAAIGELTLRRIVEGPR